MNNQTARIDLNKATWIYRGLNLLKLRNINAVAEAINDCEKAVFTFNPYNAELKEVRKYFKRIKNICKLSGHTYNTPTFKKVNGYRVNVMEVEASK